MEYIIVGDTAEYKDCLVYVCCGGREYAEQTLERMMNDPNDNDKRIMQTHKNLRVKETDNGWWDDPFLAN